MSDTFNWEVNWEVHKYKTDSVDIVRENLIEPYEVFEGKGNLLMYKGASALWQYALGNGTASAGSSLAFFNSSNTRIGVGTSTVAASGTQTDMSTGTFGTPTSSRAYGTMEAGYPLHNDGASGTSSTISFKSIFDSGAANFDWNEWAVLNGTATTSRMLNRKVQYIGTKQVGEVWTFIINITLS